VRSYRWLNGADVTPVGIADFLILDGRMPRSLPSARAKMAANLGYLEKEYAMRHPCQEQVEALMGRLSSPRPTAIFDTGLHEFILDFLADIGNLAGQIEQRDYRFYG
jgi:uncharacterized alpha-E superfamily protein